MLSPTLRHYVDFRENCYDGKEELEEVESLVTQWAQDLQNQLKWVCGGSQRSEIL